jgi:hypothetical protein
LDLDHTVFFHSAALSMPCRVFLRRIPKSVSFTKLLIYSLKYFTIITKAGITQLEECKLPKLDAAGSIPVARSNKSFFAIPQHWLACCVSSRSEHDFSTGVQLAKPLLAVSRPYH